MVLVGIIVEVGEGQGVGVLDGDEVPGIIGGEAIVWLAKKNDVAKIDPARTLSVNKTVTMALYCLTIP